MENSNSGAENATVQEKVSLQKFVKACKSKWLWFLISVVFFTGLGAFYAFRQQPKYLRSMSVLVEDQDSSSASALANSFASLGFGGGYTNVYNEMLTFMSPSIMVQVVKDLELDMNYLQKDFPHGTTLYGTNLPFKVEFLDLEPTLGGQFIAEVNPDGKMKLNKFILRTPDGKEKLEGSVMVPERFCTVKTPLGRVRFSPNPKFDGQPFEDTEKIVVRRNGFMSTVEAYAEQLKVEIADRDAQVVNLSIKDVSTERADDILNDVLNVYTKNWMADKERVSQATSDFIDKRLDLLVGELGSVDNTIATFKKEKLTPDLLEAGKLNMATTRDIDNQLLGAITALSMSRYIAEYVNNPANDMKVIPVNTIGNSSQLEAQIAKYNELLMARDNLVGSTSLANPLVQDYDIQLKGLHAAIARALNNQVVSMTNSVNSLQAAKGELKGQLAESPEMAKYLRTEERQQKIKEQLYLYLLQKREENQLSQTFTNDKTRIITPPMGSVRPIAPKKKLIILLSFMFGLVLPGGIVYLQVANDTKVRSRKDLERMVIPMLGEIPFVGKKKGILAGLLPKKSKKSGELEQMSVVVRSGSRDMVNEAFRIVRGNLDFMTHRQKNQVIMITSFNPGSGKSFVSYNLCASFALKGKSVLLIDGDLRHGSASQFVGMPSKGITSYLTGNSDDWQKFIVPVQDQPGFYVLPIGHRPPNPAELLDSDDMRALVASAKSQYDYVVIDCPPIDVVVDTQILGALVDRTIFVVRSGLLEKTALGDVEQIYHSGRFKNVTILLNGTDTHFSAYGGGSTYYSTGV